MAKTASDCSLAMACTQTISRSRPADFLPGETANHTILSSQTT